MKYNFDEIIERRNTNSVKWENSDPEVIPMWVADMDFKICPEIQNALFQKISAGIFGYEYLPSEFITTVQKWMVNRHQFIIEEKNILPAPGTLLSISAIIRTYLEKGDQIILQTPVYNHFFDLARNCELNIISNHLIYEEGKYEMDFEDLESKAAHPKTKMMILCNPHNPVGKVWNENQLRKIAEICSKNNVTIVSDEIHSDLVFHEFKHVPFGKIANDYNLTSFTCGSPCKAFNLASLSSGYIISNNDASLEKIKKTFQIQETEWLNPISSTALIAAYQYGHEWLDELKDYINKNYIYLKKYIEENIPALKIVPLEATYMVWIDCSEITNTSEELSQLIFEKTKVKFNPGTMYGEAGNGFLRINIGCPKSILIESLSRLSKYFQQESFI